MRSGRRSCTRTPSGCSACRSAETWAGQTSFTRHASHFTLHPSRING
jgi:hypothetical protein